MKTVCTSYRCMFVLRLNGGACVEMTFAIELQSPNAEHEARTTFLFRNAKQRSWQERVKVIEYSFVRCSISFG